MKYIVMTKFDAIQVFINASAAAGVTALWIELTKRAIRTVWSLINEPFYDSSSDWSDDSSDWSDDCIEESPQILKPMLPHYDSSESFSEINEPPPPYQLNSD